MKKYLPLFSLPFISWRPILSSLFLFTGFITLAQAPVMLSATQDNSTQITVSYDINVQTNGTNPTDFTVVDGQSTGFAVSVQADGTGGDLDIVLTVADMSSAVGDITVTYTNNNNEISDFPGGTNFAATDGTGVVIDTDNTAPTMSSAVQDNSTQITVTFDEDVQTNGTNPTDFTVVDGQSTGFAVSAQADGTPDDTDIVLTVADMSAAVGDITVTYTNNNAEISDFGSNALATDGTGVVIDTDNTVPTMSSAAQDNSTQITVTFDEDVQTNGTNPTDFTVVDGQSTGFAVSAQADGTPNDTDIVLTVADMSAAVGDITVTYTNNNAEISDFGGNDLATDGTGVVIDTDNTAPTMSSAAQDNSTQITVTFDEDVQTNGTNPTDFTVVDGQSTGFAVSAQADGTPDDTDIVLTVADMSAAVGDITVTYTNNNAEISDFGGNDLATDGTGVVIDTDNTAPTMSSAAQDNSTQITVTFDEDVQTNGTNPTDFTVVDGQSTGFAVSAQADGTPDDTDIVLTVADMSAAVGDITVTYTNNNAEISDFGGNDLATDGTGVVIDTDNTAPTMSSAAQDNSTQITVTFDEDVQTNGTNPTDFTVVDGQSTGFAVSAQADGTPDDTDIVLTVADMSAAVGDITVTYTNNNAEISDFGGNDLATDGTGVVIDTDNTAPTMSSAVQDNSTQITVTFDEDVQTNGTNPTDFTVQDALATSFTVSAQADGTPDDTDIVLTVADMSAAAGDITITYTNNNAEISDFGGNVLATDGTGVVINDVAAPTMASAVQDNSTQITVTFSEPVQTNGTNPTDFTVVDGQSTGFAVSAQADGTPNDTDIVLTVADMSAAVGDITVTYTNNNAEISDFGSNALATDGTGVVIDTDNTAPTMSSAVQDNSTQITVTFDEDVQTNGTNPTDFTVVDGQSTGFAVSAQADGTPDDTDIVLTVADMSAAVGDITVTYTNNNAEISDFGGNDLATDGTGVVIDTDNTAPTMSSAVQDNSTQITVTFDEDVQTNGTNPTDFTVQDALATSFTVSAQADGTPDDTDIVLTVADMSAAAGDITITYTNNNAEISDFGGNVLATDGTGVVINDVAAPTMASAVQDNSTQITVTFSEPVQTNGTNPTDFTVVDGQSTGFAVSAQADGTPNDTDIVLTVADMSAAVGDITVTYTNNNAEISDFGSNALATDGTGVVIDTDNTAPTMSSAVQDNSTQITVTFDEDVQTNGTNPTDFTVVDGQSTGFAVSAQADGTPDDTDIVLTVADMSAAVGDITVTYTNNNAEISDFGGNDLATDGTGVVIDTDNTAPTMSSAVQDNSTQITVTFDEDVQTNGTNPTDFTVQDGQSTGFAVSAQADGTPNDTDIVLTVADMSAAVGDITVTYTNNNAEISDFGSNALATDGTGVVIDTDNTAPTMSSAVQDNSTQITVTFDEDVQTNGTNPTDFTVVDGQSTGFAVSAQADGTPNDTDIVLTVADMSAAVGDITVTYTNNNAEISDFGGNDLATDGTGVVIDTDNTAPTMSSAVQDNSTQITVTFDEDVQTNGTNPTDFTVQDGQSTGFAVSAQADGTPDDTDIVLTVADMSAAVGDITVTYTNNNAEISDFGGNDLATDGTGVVIDTDNTAPEITSIVRQSPATSPTNANDVTFRVTFDEPVQNVSVDGSDFATSGAATVGGAISVVANSTTEYDVTVATISGDGLLDLDIAGGQDIADFGSNSFGGTINSEETYTIDNTAPTILDLEIFDADNDGLIERIDITFSENIDTDNGAAPVIGDLGTLTLPDGSTVTTSGGLSITDPAGLTDVVSVTGISDQTVEVTSDSLTDIDVLTGLWVDVAGNAIVAAGDDAETITDSAKPIILSSSMQTSNSYLEVRFSENVYGTSQTTPAAADWDVAFGDGADGSITNVTLGDLTNNSDVVLTAGEDTIRFSLSLTGVPDNDDDVTITPVDTPPVEVEDFAGNFMSNAQTTGAISLNEITDPLRFDTAAMDATNTYLLVSFTDSVSRDGSNATNKEAQWKTDRGLFYKSFNDPEGTVTFTLPSDTDMLNPDGSAISSGNGANDTLRVNRSTLSGTPDGNETFVVYNPDVGKLQSYSEDLNFTAGDTVIVYLADQASDTLRNAYQYDIDGDGDIDEIVVEMSDIIDTTTVGSVNSEFSLGVGSVTGFLASNANNNNLDTSALDNYITLSTTGVTTTSAVLVTFTQSALTDDAGNAVYDNTGSYSINPIDSAAPVFSAIAIDGKISNNSINSLEVGYTLSEGISSGTLVFTDDGGGSASDGSSPHNVTLTGTELSAGIFIPAILTNTPTLKDSARYDITFDGQDATGNVASTVTITNITYDTRDPEPDLTSENPTSGTVTDILTTSIDIDFDENIFEGTGDILLIDTVNMDTIKYDITNATYVTVSGTNVAIDVTDTLKDGSYYEVDIPSGVIVDAAGNNNLGLDGSTDWNFISRDITAPTLVLLSPTDDSTLVDVLANLILTFNEAVMAVDQGGDEIVVVKDEIPPVSILVDVTDTSIVTFQNEQVTINLEDALQGDLTDYYVLIESGAIADTADIPNDFGGFTAETDWNFSTEVDVTAPTLAISRAAVTNGDPDLGTNDTQVTYNLVFDEPIDVSTFGVDDIALTLTNLKVDGDASSTTGDIYNGAGNADDVTITNSGDDQSFTVTIQYIDTATLNTDGSIAITVGPNIDDASTANNAMAGAEGPSDIFNIDQTPPALEALTVTSNNGSNTARAITGDTIRIAMDFDDSLATSPTVVIKSGGASINDVVTLTETDDANEIWEASYEVSSLDTDGDISFTVNFEDAAGNAGTQVDDTDLTSGQTVTTDNTDPTVTITRDGVTLGSFIGTTDNSVSFSIVFSEEVDTVAFTTLEDITVTTTGTAAYTDTTMTTSDNIDFTYTLGGVSGDGDISIDVINNGGSNVIDSAGNVLAATVASDSFTIDNITPAITTITLEDDSVTNATTVTYRVTFDDAIDVDSLASTDFTLNTTGSASGTIDGTITEDVTGLQYLVDITSAAGDGSMDLQYTGSLSDEAGNNYSASFTAGESYRIDNIAPQLTALTIASNNGTNTSKAITANTITLTMDFDDSLASDPTVAILSGGAAINNTVTISEIDDVNEIWTASYAVNGLDVEGDITFTVDFTDAAGNAGTQVDDTDLTSGQTVTVDNSAPTVAITRGAVTLGSLGGTTDDSVAFDIVFNEEIDAAIFTIVDDITITNPGGLTFTGPSLNTSDNINFTLSFTGVDGDGDLSVSVINNGGSAVTDSAGNVLAATVASSAFTLDNTTPAITTITLEDDSVTNATTVTYRVTFDDAIDVDSLASTDFTLNTTGSASGTIDGTITEDVTGLQYLVDITSAAGDGNMDLQYTGSLSDEAGNNYSASFTAGESYRIDNIAPQLTALTIASNNGTNTSRAITGNTITLTMDFDDSLASDPTVAILSGGAAINNTVTISEIDDVNEIWTASYAVNGLDVEGDITFTVDFTDAAGNAGIQVDDTDLTSGQTVTVDNSAPTVTITRDAVTNGSFTSTNDNNVSFSIVFDEEIDATTLTVNDDISISDGGGAVTYTAPTLSTADNIDFTLSFTTVAGDGDLSISVINNGATNAVTDSAGNDLAATVASNAFTIDNTAPTVTITRNAVTSGSFTGTNDASISFDIAFSTSIDNTTFTAGDVSETNAGVTIGVGVLTNDGDDQNYTYTIPITSGDGDVDITITTLTVADDATNGLAATVTSSAITIDNTVPALTSLVIATNNGTSNRRGITGNTVTLTMDFNDDIGSDPALIFKSGGAVVDGTITVTETDAGNDIWTASYAVAGVDDDGGVTFTLNFTDDAGNNGVQVTEGAITDGSTVVIDNTVPTVAITRDAVTNGSFTSTNDNNVSFSIVFDEEIDATTLTVNDDISISDGGGAVTYTAPTLSTADNIDFTLSFTTVAGDGDLSISVINNGATNAVTDSAGNDLAATVASNAFTIDNTQPTVVITRNAVTSGSFTGTNDASISFDIAFSTPIDNTTFVAGDVTETNAGVTIGTGVLTNDGDDQNYTYTIPITSGDGDVDITITTLTVEDDATNGLAGTVTSSAITIDNTAPLIEALTIATNNGTNSDKGVTGNTVTLTMDFDDDITTDPDLIFKSGGAVVDGTITVTETDAGNDIWTATYVVNVVDDDGDVTFLLDFSDDAGNNAIQVNEGDITNASSVVIDNTAPTVTFSTGESEPTNTDPFDITATFSEGVLGLLVGDFSGSTNLAVNTVTGTGPYTINVNPTNGEDIALTLQLTGSGVTDSAGNVNALSSFNFTFDDAAPAITSSTSVLGTDLGITVSLNEPGNIYYVVMPDGAGAITGTDVKGVSGSAAGALQSGTIVVTAASVNVIEDVVLSADSTDYDLYLASEDLIAGTPNLQATATQIDLKSGGARVYSPALADICLEGDAVALGTLSIAEQIKTDFRKSATARTFKFELPSGFEFNTSAAGDVVTFQAGGDISAASISYPNNITLQLSYTVTTQNSATLDSIAISGLEVYAVGSTAQTGVIMIRNGGSGDIYLASEADSRTYATLTSVIPFGAATIEASAPDIVSTVTGTIPEIIEDSTDNANYNVLDGDFNKIGDLQNDVAVYLADDIGVTPAAITAFTVYTPNAADVVNIYSDETLLTVQYTNTGSTSYAINLNDLGLDSTDVGINSFWITSTDGNSCESAETQYSIGIFRVDNSESTLTFAEDNNSGTTLTSSFPAGYSGNWSGNGLTAFTTNASSKSVRFVPSAAGSTDSPHIIDYTLTRNSDGQSAIVSVKFNVTQSASVFVNGFNTDYCHLDEEINFVFEDPSLGDSKFYDILVYRTVNGVVDNAVDVSDTVFTTKPTIITTGVGETPLTTGWSFNATNRPQASDGDTLQYSLRIRNTTTDAVSVYATENIVVYAQPVVDIVNVNNYYCEDDGNFTLSSTISVTSGGDVATNTANITNGYLLLYSSDSTFAAPDSLNFTDATIGTIASITGGDVNTLNPSDPDQDGDAVEDETGYYRIVYETLPQTNASCTETTTYDFQLLVKPDTATLVTDLAGIGGFKDLDNDGNINDYFLEFCAGDVIPDITAQTSGDATETIVWYNDLAGTQELTGSGTNNEIILATTLFGGTNTPPSTTRTFYFAKNTDVDINSSGFEGCEAILRKVEIVVHPQPNAPNIDVSNATTAIFQSTSLGDDQYIYEYCLDDGLSMTTTMDSIRLTNNISDSRAYFFLMDSAKTDTTWITDNVFSPYSVLGFDGLSGTDTTIWVVTVTEDSTFLVPSAEFAGCYSDTTRIDINVYTTPLNPDDGEFSQGAEGGRTDFYLCSGDDLIEIEAPDLPTENSYFVWYQDDGTETAPDYGSPITVGNRLGEFISQEDIEGVGFLNTYSGTDSAKYTYWVTLFDDENDDSDFIGCESPPTKVEITVYPDPEPPLFRDPGVTHVVRHATDLEFIEASYCAGDIDNNNATFIVDGLAGAIVEFNLYTADEDSSIVNLTPLAVFSESTDTARFLATDLKITTLSPTDADTLYFLISQVNNINPNGSPFDGCETEEVDMAFLTVYVYDVPDAPTTTEAADLNIFCEDDVIDNGIIVEGEGGATFNWYEDFDDDMIPDGAFVHQGDSAGAGHLTSLADTLGNGVYKYLVSQTQNINEGAATFEGCESDYLEVIIYQVPNDPVAADPDPQCDVDVTPNSIVISYSGITKNNDIDGVVTSSQFTWYAGDSTTQITTTTPQNPDVTNTYIPGITDVISGTDTTIFVSQTINLVGASSFPGCESALVPVLITIYPRSDQPETTGDSIGVTTDRYEFCEAEDITSATLDIENPDNVNIVYNWYSDVGLTDWIFTGSSIPVTTINDETSMNINADISVTTTTSVFVTQVTETANSVGTFTGCESLPQTVDIQINPLPQDFDFTGLNAEYCYDDGSVTFGTNVTVNGSTFAASAGTFGTYTIISGATAVLIDNGDGTATFTTSDLALAVAETREGDASSHDIEFVYTSVSGCTDTFVETIVINPQPTLTMTYGNAVGANIIDDTFTGTQVCYDDDQITIQGKHFDDGTGRFEDALNGTFSLFRSSDSTAIFSGFDGDNDDGTATLLPSAVSTAGGETEEGLPISFIIEFSYTAEDGTACVNTDTATLTINPLPTLDIIMPLEVCYDEPVVNISATQISGAATTTSPANVGGYQLYTDAGLTTNAFVSVASFMDNGDGTLDIVPSLISDLNGEDREGLPKTYYLEFIFFDSGTGCINSTSEPITILPQPTLDIEMPAEVCFDDALVEFQATHISGASTVVANADTGTFTIFTDAAATIPLITTGFMDSLNGKASFDPTLVASDNGQTRTGDISTYYIKFEYSDLNSCLNSYIEPIIVHPQPNISFVGDYEGARTLNFGDDLVEICLDDLPDLELSQRKLLLKGWDLDAAGVITSGTFTGIGIVPGSPGEATFDPSVARAGNLYDASDTFDITYTYTDGLSCNNVVTKQIVVHPQPDFTFNTSGTCSDVPITFNTDLLNDSVTLVAWEWNFGDLDGDGAADISTAEFPLIDFDLGNLSSQTFNINVTIETSTGCFASRSQIVTVGAAPVPEFTWRGITQGDSTAFHFRDSLDLGVNVVKQLEYVLFNSNMDSINGLTVQNPGNDVDVTADTLLHFFTEPGVYFGRLELFGDGCSSTEERRITIVPSITVDPVSGFVEPFDTVTTSWFAETISFTDASNLNDANWFNGNAIYDSAGILSSWTIESPSGLRIPLSDDGGEVLRTNNPAEPSKYYTEGEKSWVYSPAFDFTSLEKPMVRFEYAIDFDDNKDGVVLQYSVDNGYTWLNLGQNDENGDEGSGKNWYNSQLVTSLGDYPLATTSTERENDAWITRGETTWREAKHKLDGIAAALDSLPGNTAIFRFALGANSTEVISGGTTYEGFAVDGFEIRNRLNTTLVEQFTSTLNVDNKNATESLVTLLNDPTKSLGDAIYISYFTDLLNDATDPNDIKRDLLNQRNRIDPSARVGVYGISDVPRSVLGGNSFVTDAGATEDIEGGRAWSEFELSRKALEDPLFEISNFTITGAADVLNISADFTALEERTSVATELSFYFVVIEKNVTGIVNGFYTATDTAINVMRKILPNGSGSNEVGSVALNEVFSKSFNWTITDVYDPSELAVVAFVQDDLSGEILQSAMVDAVGKENTPTGIEEAFAAGDPFVIYPNPADKSFNIELNKPAGDALKWMVYDQSGRTIQQGVARRQDSVVKIDAAEMPSGLYFIQLFNDNDRWLPKRITIIHR